MSCKEKIESFGWLDNSSNSDLTVRRAFLFCFLVVVFFFVPMGCLNESLGVGGEGGVGEGGVGLGVGGTCGAVPEESLQSVSLRDIQSI